VTNTDTRVNAANTLYTYAAAPTITSVSPTNGIMAGGNYITITGTGFASTSVYAINGVTCGAPAAPVGTISATNNSKNVTGVGTNFLSAFVVGDSIVSNGQTKVINTITSDTVMTVTANITPALSAKAVTKGAWSTTKMLCLVPSSATSGAKDVTVTNVDGQVGTLTSGYTYNPRPVITSISPTRGAIGGGTILTLNGTNFDSTATVQVGTAACTAAPAIIGTVASTSGNILTGTSSNFLSSIAVGDTISLPTATSTVARIVTAITDNLHLTVDTAYATSGNTRLPIAGGTITKTASSTTSKLCVTPAGAAGLADVIITNVKLNGVTDGQTGTLPISYLYAAAPTVSSVSPNFKDVLGGGTITILGANFQTGATAVVKIDTAGTNVSCTSVSVVDSSHITCIAPAHAAGAVDVQVTNADGQLGTLASALTYNAAPVVTTISPAGGALAGGNTLTVSGTFDTVGTNSVTVGGASCAVLTSSATQITCTLLGASAGAASVVVTNSIYGQNSVNQPTYLYSAAPTFTSVTPSLLDIAGAHTVTINGANFRTGATVTFREVGASADIGGCGTLTVVSSSQITCIAPAMPITTTGSHFADITITNTDTQSVTTSGGVFTYQLLAAPVLTAITETKNTVAASGAHTVNLPTGITAGETLIVCYEALLGGTLTAPVNWTQIGTTTAKAACVYKIASGLEGASVSFSTSGSSTYAAHAMRITGANAITPIDDGTSAPVWNATNITSSIKSSTTWSLYLQVFFASSSKALTSITFNNGVTAAPIPVVIGGYTFVATGKEVLATASKTISTFGTAGSATTATYNGATPTITSKASLSIIITP
jgi:hypothetical protein